MINSKTINSYLNNKIILSQQQLSMYDRVFLIDLYLSFNLLFIPSNKYIIKLLINRLMAQKYTVSSYSSDPFNQTHSPSDTSFQKPKFLHCNALCFAYIIGHPCCRLCLKIQRTKAQNALKCFLIIGL